MFNGLLLAAHWDAAFDRCLVSFDDEGRALVKPALDPAVIALLSPSTVPPISLALPHREQFAWHQPAFAFA